MTRAVALIALVMAMGCDDGDTAEMDDTDVGPSGPCAFHTGDVYTPGLRKTADSSVFDVIIIGAVPDPPDRGDNTFVFQVRDHDTDATIDGATLTVTPTMPEHNHGTSPASFTGVGGSDGEYEVGPIDLFMGGVWHVLIDIESPTDASDQVSFDLCLEG